MKKLISFFTVVFCFQFLAMNVNAQVSSYVFTQSNGTFVPVLPSGTPASTFSATWDDNVSSNQALGYTFTYNAVNFTAISIASNGFIVMGTAAGSNGTGTAYYGFTNDSASRSGLYIAGTGNNNGIAVFNMDLQARTFPTFTGARTIGSAVITGVSNFTNLELGLRIAGTGITAGTIIIALDAGAGTVTMSSNATLTSSSAVTPSSSIIISTTGVAPNRTTTVQWIAAKRFSSNTPGFTGDNIDAQVILSEGGGVAANQTITTVYNATTTRQTVGAQSNGVQVGLRGASSADYNIRSTSTDWSNTTAGTTNRDTCVFKSTVVPVSGLTFVWTPPAPVGCTMVIANLNPTGTISPGCSPQMVAPKVNISNSGGSAQTAISVTYAVTSESYSETVSAPDLASGANEDVTFPATLPINALSPGVKAVTITVNTTCNAGPQVYTLNTSYTVSASNPNFGGGSPPANCNYFFANSSPGASCAPNQPVYFWEDTTGSTYLTLNGAITTPLNTGGSLDDGSWTITPPFASGDGVSYCGTCYTQFVIGTNGQIGFGPSLTNMDEFAPLNIPSTAASRPAMFPLWHDFNWANANVVTKSISYKVDGQKLIITYCNAPRFGGNANDYVTFQVIMEIGISCGTGDGALIAQYDDAASGSTFLAANTANFPADSITVGIQDAAGTLGIQYKRSVNGAAKNPGAGPLFSSPLAVAFGPNNQALPVELSSFTSFVSNRNVTLNWSTSSEENNQGFDIEKSSVNGTWSKIGNVAGNGTTSSQHEYSYTDKNLTTGKYSYRLKQIDYNGNTQYFNLSNEVNIGVPTKYELSQNYPNPFNPSTSINYEIPFDGKVSLKIFDMSGKEVATLVNEVKTAGYYSYNFNASSLSSGVYFYSLSASNFTATKKMLLVK